MTAAAHPFRAAVALVAFAAALAAVVTPVAAAPCELTQCAGVRDVCAAVGCPPEGHVCVGDWDAHLCL